MAEDLVSREEVVGIDGKHIALLASQDCRRLAYRSVQTILSLYGQLEAKPSDALRKENERLKRENEFLREHVGTLPCHPSCKWRLNEPLHHDPRCEWLAGQKFLEALAATAPQGGGEEEGEK